MAQLVVRSGPRGARVYVRGVYRGKLPLARPLVVIPGPLQLEVLGDDGSRATRDFVLAARTLGTIDLTTPAPEPAAPPQTLPPPAPNPPASTPSAPAMPTAEQPVAGTPLGWVFIGTGAATVIAGAALIPIANGKIADARNALGGLCAVPAGSDACANARAGSQNDAQSEVNTIASWKAVRTGAFIGLGAGVVALGTGAFFVAQRSRPAHARLEPHFDFDRAHALLGVRGSF
jgi:hypothetical protein